jgi:hypothetical protein
MSSSHPVVLDSIVKIRAECHTDNYAYAEKFDAEPFFRSASPEEIIALAACEWGGDYPADQVAWFFDAKPGYENITGLFEYIENTKSGFECHVFYPDAMSWLSKNRPDVLQIMTEKMEENVAALSASEDSTPYWDRDQIWNGEYSMEKSASESNMSP